MKKGDNSKGYGSIVIPKAREVQKSLFRVSIAKERKDMSISLPWFVIVLFCFFSCFRLYPACREGLEDKTYPAMNSPVNGESDGESCILVEH